MLRLTAAVTHATLTAQLEGVQILRRAEADAALGNHIDGGTVENARSPFELGHVLNDRECTGCAVRAGFKHTGDLCHILVGLERIRQLKYRRMVERAGPRRQILRGDFANQRTTVVKDFAAIGSCHGQAKLTNLFGGRDVQGRYPASHGGRCKTRSRIAGPDSPPAGRGVLQEQTGTVLCAFLFLILGGVEVAPSEVDAGYEYIGCAMRRGFLSNHLFES